MIISHCRRTLVIASLMLASLSQATSLVIPQANGPAVELDAPVSRIVSLAPSITELLFDIDAGDRVLGTVDWSNYPEAAKAVPRIGDYSTVNYEAVLALNPEVVLYVWESEHVSQLRSLGLTTLQVGAETFEGIAQDLRTLGQLTGQAQGEQLAQHFEQTIAEWQAKNVEKPKVKGFFQVSMEPIFTVSDSSFIGAVLTTCGIDNVFGSLEQAYPQVNVEAVVASNAELIISSTEDTSQLDFWRGFDNLPAVQHPHGLVTVSGDDISRPVPGLLKGLAQVCAAADAVRP